MKKQSLLQYPDHTKGSKAAAKAREACNQVSDDQREASFRRGMAMIYGQGDKATCSRH